MDDRVCGFGSGEGGEEKNACKVYVVVLQAHGHLRWNGVLSEGLVTPSPPTRQRHLYSKQPRSSRTPTCPLSTSYSQSSTAACVIQVDIHRCFLQISAPTHPHSLFTSFPYLFHTRHLILRFYSLFAVWNSAVHAVDVRRRFCARFVVV